LTNAIERLMDEGEEQIGLEKESKEEENLKQDKNNK